MCKTELENQSYWLANGNISVDESWLKVPTLQIFFYSYQSLQQTPCLYQEGAAPFFSINLFL